MTTSIFTRLGDEITAAFVGQVSVLACNTTAQTQDLAAIGPGQIQDMRNEDALPVAGGYAAAGVATTTQQNVTLGGCVGRFTEFFADGVDIGILFASNAAAFTASTSANLAATGGNGNGCCVRVPAGSYRTIFIHPSSRFLSYIAANTTSNLRICATSRTG